jgi:hypothetical protein
VLSIAGIIMGPLMSAIEGLVRALGVPQLKIDFPR